MGSLEVAGEDIAGDEVAFSICAISGFSVGDSL